MKSLSFILAEKAKRDPRYTKLAELAKGPDELPLPKCQHLQAPVPHLLFLRCSHPEAGPVTTWKRCQECKYFAPTSAKTAPMPK